MASILDELNDYNPNALRHTEDAKGVYQRALRKLQGNQGLHPERFTRFPFTVPPRAITERGQGRLGLSDDPVLIRALLLDALRRIVANRGMVFRMSPATEHAIERVVRFATRPHEAPIGLLLHGGVGSGKSTLVTALYSLLQQSPDVIEARQLRRPTDLLAEFTAASAIVQAYNQEEVDNIAHRAGALYRTWQCQHLFIDDLGVELVTKKIYGTDYRPMELLMYFRYDRMLPTVITTNLRMEDILMRYGERFCDRVREMFEVVDLIQPSFRGQFKKR